MSDPVRRLNDEGISHFQKYLSALKDTPDAPVPFNLLTDPSFSADAAFTAAIEHEPHGRPYKSAYELGHYLSNNVLKDLSKPAISRDYTLWNWLTLYLFDELCPLINGRRELLEPAAYIFEKRFNYARYYRHLVRNAWILVKVHGAYSKVLLSPGAKSHANPVAIRTDLQMQLSATQQFVESDTVIKTAYALYYDETSDRLKVGSATKGGGAPRRLVSVLNQFDLTYDLHAAPTETLFALMPKEFDRFKSKQSKGSKSAQGTA